jgi:hypothetical protein
MRHPPTATALIEALPTVRPVKRRVHLRSHRGDNGAIVDHVLRGERALACRVDDQRSGCTAMPRHRWSRRNAVHRIGGLFELAK